MNDTQTDMNGLQEFAAGLDATWHTDPAAVEALAHKLLAEAEASPACRIVDHVAAMGYFRGRAFAELLQARLFDPPRD
jgi:hypothetical protein